MAGEELLLKAKLQEESKQLPCAVVSAVARDDHPYRHLVAYCKSIDRWSLLLRGVAPSTAVPSAVVSRGRLSVINKSSTPQLSVTMATPTLPQSQSPPAYTTRRSNAFPLITKEGKEPTSNFAEADPASVSTTVRTDSP